ncbi:AMP-binding protein [Halomarina ordinaria]|uniref:AMP-binding protein n=1 Tax=Halomarina ordinaria TaxID=3033939 RepID=A0ABD5U7J1_9EURY|nr:AMP-binding protein [Halomarina sp. PSRA2]
MDDQAPRVLGDLLARERRSDAPALLAPALDRAYDYHRLLTNAWKTGNFLRHLGVREGTVVAVVADPVPEAVLSVHGAALLGATVRVLPPGERAPEARALVAPADRLAASDPDAATQCVVYGAPPDDPSVSYFERDVWSENPTEPPDVVAPETPLLTDGDEEYTHRQVLAAARSVVEEWSLDATSRVAVRASLSDPGTVVVGLVAPLLAGAATLFPDDEARGTLAVATDDAPEAMCCSPEDVLDGSA